MVGVVAAFCWGGGYLIGGLGILTHQLWLLYLGYGVIGGCGLGLGYVSPVSTLIRWFPDRRGMATGMAIMGAAERVFHQDVLSCAGVSRTARSAGADHRGGQALRQDWRSTS